MAFLRNGTLALLLGAIVAGASVAPAVAQDQNRGRLSQDDRPYDDKLMRLSEILGAIHYLRALCGADEGQTWRDQMKELLESEGTTAIRRAKLVKGFNKGYRGYRRTYRSCTETARVAIDRFMEEGVAISEALLKENR